jgi:hypothetical protein
MSSMKRHEPPATDIVEADLLLSDKKLPRIQVAGLLVLGFAYLSLPVLLLVVTVLAVVRHERFDFDPVTNVIVFIGALAVSGLFGYAGYRLIRRALRK